MDANWRVHLMHFLCFLLLGLLQALQGTCSSENSEPEIISTIPNMTVAVGREARIPCAVKNLGSYRVAWLRVESKTILTIHHHVITRNYRISLSHSDDRHWNLHINDVQESDRGGYMCQINTVPMEYQVGYLDVVVPPEITADTSSDVMVRENLNVSLKCTAKGYPKPSIKWKREDGKPVDWGNWQERKSLGLSPPDVYEGETLTINRVSRLHMGAYLAIASNGVPPSVSKRILLNVHFPPMIWVPNQSIPAAVGGEAVLVCNTEAYPISINYWTRDEEESLMPGVKYEIVNSEKSYKVQMTLRIRELSISDFTTYKCFARNSLGSTQGSIKLYASDTSASSSSISGSMSNSGSSRSTASNVFSASTTGGDKHNYNRYNNNNRGLSVRKTGDNDSDDNDAANDDVIYVKKSSHLRNSSSKNSSCNAGNSYYTILLLLLPHLTFTVQSIAPLLPLTLSHQLTNFLFL